MRYTFIRHDRDPKLSYLFSSYEETANTGAMYWQGQQLCCLRLNSETGRMVAKIQGWKDITQDLARKNESEKKVEDQTENTIGKDSEKKESTKVVEKTIKRKATKRKTRSKK